MKEFNAYCRFCQKNVTGKTTAITILESGNYLHIGECLECFYEIRRVVPRNKEIIDDPNPGSWNGL